jgi:hypothetical protein
MEIIKTMKKNSGLIQILQLLSSLPVYTSYGMKSDVPGSVGRIKKAYAAQQLKADSISATRPRGRSIFTKACVLNPDDSGTVLALLRQLNNINSPLPGTPQPIEESCVHDQKKIKEHDAFAHDSLSCDSLQESKEPTLCDLAKKLHAVSLKHGK